MNPRYTSPESPLLSQVARLLFRLLPGQNPRLQAFILIIAGSRHPQRQQRGLHPAKPDALLLQAQISADPVVA